MKPLTSPSGRTTTHYTEQSSIVPQQDSPYSRPQATKQLPSPQQRKITPARSQGLQQPSSGIRQLRHHSGEWNSVYDVVSSLQFCVGDQQQEVEQPRLLMHGLVKKSGLKIASSSTV